MAKTRVAVVTSSDLIRLALKTLLISHPYRVVVFPTISQFRHSQFPANFVLVQDVQDDEYTLKQQLQVLQISSPTYQVLVMASRCEPAFVQNLVQAGADGFLCLQDELCQWISIQLSDPENKGLLLSPSAERALNQIQHFQSIHLSDYQRQVLSLMLQLKSAKEIAQLVDRSIASVYQVQFMLRDIFCVSSNNELILKAQALNLS